MLGEIGVLREKLGREFDLRDPVALAELDLDETLAAARWTKAYRPLPQCPSVQRDVALVVDAATTHEQVMAVFSRFRKNMVESIRLFDIFSGKTIPSGKKSMAYSLTYRAPDRTLTDTEVNKAHDEIVARLKTELQCEVRAE